GFGGGLRTPLAVLEPVIAHDRRDAQPIILENPGAACSLRLAVLRMRAPTRDSLLVAPERQRQDLALLRQALKALDRDEAVDLLELGAQFCGEIEIVLAPARSGLDLENDGIHRSFLLAAPRVNAVAS